MQKPWKTRHGTGKSGNTSALHPSVHEALFARVTAVLSELDAAQTVGDQKVLRFEMVHDTSILAVYWFCTHHSESSRQMIRRIPRIVE